MKAIHYTHKEREAAQHAQKERERQRTHKEIMTVHTTNRQREETDTTVAVKKKKKKIIKKLLTNVGCHVIIELAPFLRNGHPC